LDGAVMRKVLIALIAGAVLGTVEGGRTQAPRSLDFHFLDMEGCGGALIVAPSGKSIVVGAGNPGVRDAERIIAAAKEAGLTRIDYSLPSHYHPDHYGAVAELVARFPIRTFIDLGSTLPAAGSPALTNSTRKFAGSGRLHLAGLTRP